MKRGASPGAGSLDMLLDTMCNTFGGVCFIALLVAILSAMLPKDTAAPEEDEPDVAALVEDERMAQLLRRRDELKAAAELQRELLAAATNDTGAITVTEAELVAKLSEKDDSLKELQEKLRGMEEEIARLSTSDEYNKAEAERLRKLAEELRKEIAKAEDARRRTVRTPLERELGGVSPFDLWIRGRFIYVGGDPSQCHCDEEGYGDNKRWHYTVLPERGARLDAAYLRSPDFDAILRRLGGMTYARIYIGADRDSFASLCLLRDELVRLRLRYNWYVNDGDTLDFVSGRDEKVQ